MGVLAAETMTTGSFNMSVSLNVSGKDRRPSGRLGKQLPPDQPAADLGRSRSDLVELRVAPQAPGRVIVDVAVAAQTLDRFARHPSRFFRRVEDGAGRIFARARSGKVSAVQRLADRIDVGSRGIQGRVHVGEL